MANSIDSMKNNLTVLVNSTDSFEDCWIPFFTLFKHYWPQCTLPIVLNTETKLFQFDGLDISCSHTQKANEEGTRIPWSDCLIRCLDNISTKYVLYLQDDYFINKLVDQDFIASALEIMSRNNIGHIRLYEMDRSGVNENQASSYHPLLWEIKQLAGYRINLQAGLWRVDTLLSYLVPGESGWQFERNATKRSYSRNEIFLCQSLDHFNSNGELPVNYQPTGIIRGKWYKPAVIDLFEAHGIKVNYSRRGFYSETGLEKIRVKTRFWLRKMYMWLHAKLTTKQLSGTNAQL